MKNTHITQPDNAPKCTHRPTEQKDPTQVNVQDSVPEPVQSLASIFPEFHAIRDPGSGTATYFFGLPNCRLEREFIEISNLSVLPSGAHSCHPGYVFGGEPGSPITLVIRAAPSTFIRISDPTKNSFRTPPLLLNVGKDSDINLVPKMERDSLGSHMITIPRIDPTKKFLPPMNPDDDDLCAIFADSELPEWLREILDAQLRSWDKHHVETYYRYSPFPVRGREFVRLIKAAPYWALKRWKEELFSDQVTYCMYRSPAGAAAFCPERIRPIRQPDQ